MITQQAVLPAQYVFTSDWFSHNIAAINVVFDYIQPQKILEIGSHEGRSALYFAEKALQYHRKVGVCCVDHWENIKTVQGYTHEQLFDHNIRVAQSRFPGIRFVKYKQKSHLQMMDLITKGRSGYFDFIYVDGSHKNPDVLLDALLAHHLVRIGGVIAFDDYLWSPSSVPTNQDHYSLIKPAVDHYVNSYQEKVQILQMLPCYQLYVQKIAL